MGDVRLEKVHEVIDVSPTSATVSYVATINGATFGYSAEVRVATDWQSDKLEVEAGQGSIGNRDPRVALIRALLYAQAAMRAAQIQRALDQGAGLLESLDLTEQEAIDAKGKIVTDAVAVQADIEKALASL